MPGTIVAACIRGPVSPGGRNARPRMTLALIHWLAGIGALTLFVYLGFALLRPEKF